MIVQWLGLCIVAAVTQARRVPTALPPRQRPLYLFVTSIGTSNPARSPRYVFHAIVPCGSVDADCMKVYSDVTLVSQLPFAHLLSGHAVNPSLSNETTQ